VREKRRDARVPEQDDPHRPSPSSAPEHVLLLLDERLEPGDVVLDGRDELAARVVRRVDDRVERDPNRLQDRLQAHRELGEAAGERVGQLAG